MAKKELEFRFLGFRRTSEFKPLDRLQPEEYYPLGEENPKSCRIVDTMIEVLNRPSRGVLTNHGGAQKDRPGGG